MITSSFYGDKIKKIVVLSEVDLDGFFLLQSGQGNTNR